MTTSPILSRLTQGTILDNGYVPGPVVDRGLLIRWHLVDLPDDAERARNDAIEALQQTRNPFIDEPALAGLVGP